MTEKRHLARAKPMIRRDLGVLMSSDNQQWLNAERVKHGTADVLEKTECQRCGWCCLRMPCIATPDELVYIARYLELSVRELIKTKMVIDLSLGRVYPKWAKESQLDMAGKMLPYNRTYDRGYCIMFDRKTHDCLIQKVKPHTAVICRCWDWTTDDNDPVSEWSRDLLLKLCPEVNLKEV